MLKPVDLQFDPDSIQGMIDDLQDLYDDEQLSKWEMSFMTNLMARIELGETLTEPQFEKLKEIHEDNKDRF